MISVFTKIKQAGMVRVMVSTLNWMIREGLVEQVTLKVSFEWSEGAALWKKCSEAEGWWELLNESRSGGACPEGREGGVVGKAHRVKILESLVGQRKTFGFKSPLESIKQGSAMICSFLKFKE